MAGVWTIKLPADGLTVTVDSVQPGSFVRGEWSSGTSLQQRALAYLGSGEMQRRRGSSNSDDKDHVMSSLPPKIEALLCKAEADASAARRDFSRARTLYERAWSIDRDCIEAEQLARLYFLAQDWKALESHVSFVSDGRRLVWETLLQAHEGRQVSWPDTASKWEHDSAYKAWLLVLASRTAEALEVGMDYFRTVEAGWERDFMGRTLLNLQPAQCCGCRSKPAIGYFHDRPVCADCRSFVEDESALMEAMEGNDPGTARLIENISGEPFVPQRAYDFVRVQRPPDWQSPPAKPLFEIEDSAALVELLDDQAKDCWLRALELAGQEQMSVALRHLWQALLELPDSAYGVLVPKEVHVIRTAFPVEVDLRWVLNIARWGAALFPYRVSEFVSPLDLLLALTWTLPTSGRLPRSAVSRASARCAGCGPARYRPHGCLSCSSSGSRVACSGTWHRRSTVRPSREVRASSRTSSASESYPLVSA